MLICSNLVPQRFGYGRWSLSKVRDYLQVRFPPRCGLGRPVSLLPSSYQTRRTTVVVSTLPHWLPNSASSLQQGIQ